MLVADGLTFREIVMNDPLPKGVLQASVVEFLKGRTDAAIYGALAVNAYVDERRMTEDVDVVSTCAEQLAEDVRQHLNKQFHIAVRVREVRDGIGFRVYQLLKPANRHLVDVRSVELLPPTQLVDGVPVITPTELVASKVISCLQRKGKPKAFTDRRDLAHLFLRFPELKSLEGDVRDRLIAAGADEQIMAFWRELVAEAVLPADEDDEFA